MLTEFQQSVYISHLPDERRVEAGPCKDSGVCAGPTVPPEVKGAVLQFVCSNSAKCEALYGNSLSYKF